MKNVKALLVVVMALISSGCFSSGVTPPQSQDFTAIGRVTLNYQGLADIMIIFSTVGSVRTDSNGNWSMSGLTGVVTVIPQSDNYEFTPAQAQVSRDSTRADFTASIIAFPQEYTASGRITYDNQGLAGIAVALSTGNDVSTDSNGDWSASGLTGTVTLTPQSEEYLFEPHQAQVSANNPVADFIAVLKNPSGVAPQTPDVDYVVPLADQPFSNDPEVIWYDSFDTGNVPDRYMEYTEKDKFYQTSEEALGGTGKSMKGVFNVGTVSAGSLKVGFGDWPGGYQSKVINPGEKYDCVYWRIYVKHQEGWSGNPAKLSRVTSVASNNWTQAMIAHVWGGAGNTLTLDPASGIDPVNNQLKTTKYNDFSNLRWLGNKPSGTYPIFATEESGKWVAVEAAVKLNTPGANDGWFYLWIDGQLDTAREGLNWRGTWDECGINAVFLENYWNDGSPYNQVRYFDDFVISTEPIGLARASVNPEIVKTPFRSAQAGRTQGAWQVQISGSLSEQDLVWDSGIIYGNGLRVTVDSENGMFVGELVGMNSLEPENIYAARVRQRDNTGKWSDWSSWRYVIQTQ
jgi:hypothetical protein